MQETPGFIDFCCVESAKVCTRMTDDAKALKRRIDKLEDELKAAERRVAEIKTERDEATDLVERMREHVEDATRMIDSWCEAFGMQQNGDGKWTYAAWVDEREAD